MTTQPPTVVAVGDVDGLMAGGVGTSKDTTTPGVRRDHCDTELRRILFLCGERHGSTLLPTIRGLSGGK